MMKAEELMADVKGISGETSILDAEKAFVSNGVDVLPVVDGEWLIGVITISDIARALPSQAVTLSKWELHYLLGEMKITGLIRKPVSVSPKTDLMEIVELALEKKVFSFPVVENGRLIGMLYKEKIIKFLLDEIRRPAIKVEVNFTGNSPGRFSFLKSLRIGGVL